MTKIDQFESVFKSATKAVFHYKAPHLEKVCVVTDLEGHEHQQFVLHVRQFLSALDPDTMRWTDVEAKESADLEALVQRFHDDPPDLICTYRNLHSGAWRWPYSLGETLHVLTQGTNIPVLVLPRPDQRDVKQLDRGTQTVLAVTTHLAGDDRLVNTAAHLTAPGGTLTLTHVEDQDTFETYIGLISKIPSIDTDEARKTIHKQLLKEPTDYIASCRAGLESAKNDLTVKAIVALGPLLTTYQYSLEEHDVDLLVLNTKDENQHAMHHLAYILAVELRDLPLLML